MTNLLKFALLGNAETQPTPPNGTKDLPTLHTGSKNKLWSARARLARFLFARFSAKNAFIREGGKILRGFGGAKPPI